MKKIFLVLTAAMLSLSIFAQQGTIKGVIKDAETDETLIGANVLIKAGVGTVTDFNGEFSLQVDPGEYNLSISYVGYESTIRKVQVIGEKTVILNISLKTITLNEVTIVADVARSRETPVAFTNILPAKIEAELGTQDLPMILNSTPGVYATQQGGGDGDARITIRGFNQRNVAVMLDGIPVNDMENGWVYWSNWFGLDAVTRQMQVQRGLGASKLAIPSVGGTINIITKGIESKFGGNVKQQVGSDGYMRTSLGFTSGKLKNGWGVTLAGSYKQGDGWVDLNWTKGWFYFAKIEKQFKKHTLSVTAMGAPQQHGQRSYAKPISKYDKDYAAELGVDTTGRTDYGLRYNSHWGYLERWTFDENGDTIHTAREKHLEKMNYYHKPQFSLKDSWNISDKLFLSNIFYVSIGNGGGTGLTESTTFDETGQLMLQSIYDNNYNNNWEPGRAGTAVYSSINNHYWYGFLSTINYKPTNLVTFSGGIDVRSYKGIHYRKLYDMLGGEFFYDEKYIDASGTVNNSSIVRKKHKDDIFYYHNDGLVRWGGVFGQAEFKHANWSAFLNLTTSMSSYKRVDYFEKKIVDLGDTVFNVGVNRSVINAETGNYSLDSVFYKGIPYTINSPEAKVNETDWTSFLGYTIKTGVNYNVSEKQNVFFNLGYIKKAPRFNNVFYQGNRKFKDIEYEKIKACEIGYTFKSSKFSVNSNWYITLWDNKPADRVQTITIDDVSYAININGMNAKHLGWEVDFIYKPIPKLNFQGTISLGDWTWTSKDTALVVDESGVIVERMGFDAKGVHVGDAAQIQFGGSVEYEVIEKLFIKARATYFGKHYSKFDPTSLNNDENPDNGSPDWYSNAGRESWKVPNYYLIDLNLRYYFKIQNQRFFASLNFLNLLNRVYISDAVNNDTYTQSYDDFDAQSAAVFFGMGTRYSISLKYIF
ncbi:MAG: TonB-dependent receptor [Bacteroidetes bacterium]|nr:TonB-dependent receptor [Bacteroidota bacterium]